MKKISFRKFEHMILPRFRQRSNKAESIEDIRKAFISSILDLFEKALGGRVVVGYEDVDFRPYERPYFFISERLLGDDYVLSMWKDSDIRQTVERLAQTAMNRYKHLEKHCEKTNAKIRMNVFR